MSEDGYGRKLQREMLEQERGTWREALRERFSPWFDSLDWGFKMRDGWREIVEGLTVEIASITGGPEAAPDLRIAEVKQKFGRLRCYVWFVPAQHEEAVEAAIGRAEKRSLRTCEVCGKRGKLVNSAGYWHTACPEHEDPMTFRSRG